MSNSPGWNLRPLGEIATIRNGLFASRPDEDSAGTPILRISAVRDGYVNVNDRRYVHNVAAGRIAQFTVASGDLLLTRYNGSRQLVGIAGIVPEHDGQVLHPDKLIRVQVSPTVADSRFINYQLASDGVRQFLEPRIRTTAGQSGISGADVKAIPVLLPPLQEQRRIVDILEDHLSRLDAAAAGLITARRRLVAYQRAALNRLTEEVATRHIALGDALAAVEAGRSFGGAARPSFDDEWGIVKVSAMTWGEFRPAENKLVSDPSQVDLRYQIHSGDLLMSRANTSEYVGAPVLVRAEPARLLLSDKSLRLVPRDGVSPEYLWRVLSAPRARAQISELASGNQDSMRNISQATLKTIVIPWTDRQHDVIGAANELDDQRVRMSIVIDRTQTRGAALRRALLRAAFSGLLTGRAADLDRAEESIA